MREPAWPGYFADPFVLVTDSGYVAYGTDPTADLGDEVFEALVSDDLVHWASAGRVLQRPDTALGDAFWAPEVAAADGAYSLYYSVGHDIAGHHLRVARADDPLGPFHDTGAVLTPDEPFAIDADPFTDRDGARYLFFARDRTDAARPGTRLAVGRLTGPDELVDVRVALEPDADWQIYERDRSIYGRRLTWHTLEGPSVVARGDGVAMFFSGGSWEGDGYGVSVAYAPHPLGPWHHAPAPAADVLSTALTGLPGPGHCSVFTAHDGRTIMAFHAWDDARTRRRMHLGEVVWSDGTPRVVPLR